MPPFEYTLDHILVSTIASILGIIIGGFIIYLAARILENSSFQSPSRQRNLLLIPWRTPIVGLLEFFFFPVPFLSMFGIGLEYGIASTTGQLACLVVLFTPVWVFRKEPVQSKRLFYGGVLRSIMTLSVAMTTSAAGLSIVGLGYSIRSGINGFYYSQAINAYLITILICLAIDFGAGILQFFLWNLSPFQTDKSTG